MAFAFASALRPGTTAPRSAPAVKSSGAKTRAIKTRSLEPDAAQPNGGTTSNQNLVAERFRSDPVLESVLDGEVILRAKDRPTGPAVEKIQQALVDLGFALPRFGVDGTFGAETERAVQKFQTASGFAPDQLDGRVGPITMEELDARFAGTTEQSEATPPTALDPVEDGDMPEGSTEPAGEKSKAEQQGELEVSRSSFDDREQRGGGLLAKAGAGEQIPAPAAGKGATIKHIDVNLAAPSVKIEFTDKKLKPEMASPVSTGRGCPNTKKHPCPGNNGMYCTPDGSFKVQALGKGGASYVSSLGDPMPFFTIFCQKRGIGFHKGIVPKGGRARSHGCVRLATLAFAKMIHDNVTRNTTVHVHGDAKTAKWSLEPAACKAKWKDCGELCSADKKNRPGKAPAPSSCV